MIIRRLLISGTIILLPIVSVLGTWNYQYGPNEYVTVANGISPDGKIAITAHGSGELGDENFHLYLTDAGTGKKIGPLEEIKEFLDTGAGAFGAMWSSDGLQGQSSGESIATSRSRPFRIASPAGEPRRLKDHLT